MDSKKTFYIFDSFLLPTPYNTRFFVEKFANGFKYYGYKVKIAKKISDIKESGFVMISTHDWYYSFGSRGLKKSFLNQVISKIHNYDPTKILKKISLFLKKSTIRSISKRIKNKDVTIIAWFWSQHADFFKKINSNVIFTGEYFYGTPSVDSHKKWRNFYLSNKNAIPIKFSADVNPDKVGEGCINTKYDIGFVGNKEYKKNYYNQFKDYNSCIIPTPPFISEKQRIDIYKNSKIILGLHSKQNIDNKVVVERVFESLACGAICLTDNHAAIDATNGCAVYIKDENDCKKKFDFFCNNKKERMKLRNKGLDFIRNKGTYSHIAKEFIYYK